MVKRRVGGLVQAYEFCSANFTNRHWFVASRGRLP
nr:MAG TPA_asm: hypothetical protein [Caudoviricetes sp.]